MSSFNLLMPKLGESVQEATITKWFKKVGDTVEEEDPILEIATDKVDSEIPSPVDGKIVKILFEEDAVVAVGEIIAVIDLEGEGGDEEPAEESAGEGSPEAEAEKQAVKEDSTFKKEDYASAKRFYSPVVKNIADKENIPLEELENIKGTGINGRVKKDDLLAYLEKRSEGKPAETEAARQPAAPQAPSKAAALKHEAPRVSAGAGDQVVEMDRMRRLIADHMVMSKEVSPHVTNFVEADVTGVVQWRNKHKDAFQKREGIKLTYMPVFAEAIAKGLKDYPGVNASVDGYNIILRKNVNLGIAVALPSGNLIVPVVKNADQKNLLGLAHEINTLADQARQNKIAPDDIQGGTFSISNFGTFRNVTGTPIINQPQVAIMAVGTIEKKPAVLETPEGDVIAIRHKMMLALTYDHRVVDGALGGAFLRKVADYLEGFDVNRTI